MIHGHLEHEWVERASGFRIIEANGLFFQLVEAKTMFLFVTIILTTNLKILKQQLMFHVVRIHISAHFAERAEHYSLSNAADLTQRSGAVSHWSVENVNDHFFLMRTALVHLKRTVVICLSTHGPRVCVCHQQYIYQRGSGGVVCAVALQEEVKRFDPQCLFCRES